MTPPRIIAGRYEVEAEIGRGGMGAVYRVRHVHTGAGGALKLMIGAARLSADAVARFRREARISARVTSENIVRVLDADTAPELDDAPFLVMELLDGESLERLVEREGPLPPARVVALLREVAHGLGRAHEAGIVHRDLKPENLFLHRSDRGEIVKILDFGISKLVDSSGLEEAALTRTGALLGTPLYMAPEQARGRGADVSPRTDIWALGLIATFLLTGETYWQAESMAELLAQVLYEPLPLPSARWPTLGLRLDAWFARCVARSPLDRFATVAEAFAAFDASVSGRAEPAAFEATLPMQRSPVAGLGPPPGTPPPGTPAGALDATIPLVGPKAETEGSASDAPDATLAATGPAPAGSRAATGAAPNAASATAVTPDSASLTVTSGGTFAPPALAVTDGGIEPPDSATSPAGPRRSPWLAGGAAVLALTLLGAGILPRLHGGAPGPEPHGATGSADLPAVAPSSVSSVAPASSAPPTASATPPTASATPPTASAAAPPSPPASGPLARPRPAPRPVTPGEARPASTGSTTRPPPSPSPTRAEPSSI